MRNAARRSSAWRGASFRSVERGAQAHRHGIAVAAAEQVGFERIEMGELLRARKRRMIGDIVGGTDEFIKGEDRAAMLRADQHRSDREILVPMALSRPQVRRRGHFAPAAAWKRPFHRPPLPRMDAIADWTVNTR